MNIFIAILSLFFVVALPIMAVLVLVLFLERDLNKMKAELIQWEKK